MKAAKTNETMDVNLIKILREGPEVSLKGSPTVSPTTAALWASEPFPPKFPSSIYFFALSQEPPALAIITAIVKPTTITPANKPVTPLTPNNNPTIIGAATAIRAGPTISAWAAWAHISRSEERRVG